MDIEKLVRMANQIAANSDYGPDKEKVAATVADHLTRFWTPAMRKAIIEGHRDKRIDLTPMAANSDYGPDKEKVAATVADHLTRFWTPAMRKAIIEGHRDKRIDLTPMAA